MREFVIIACVVGSFCLIAWLGRTASTATGKVDQQITVEQLKAELTGARAEAGTLREQLKRAQEEVELLRRKLAEQEKQKSGGPR